jgi:hypothetical protein
MNAPNLLIRIMAASLVLLLSVMAAPSPGLAEKPSPDAGADYDNNLPAMAYNYRHRQFFIVWHRKRTDGCREIWGRRVTETGQLLSHFAIASGPCPQNRMQPAVVYNASRDEYLVAWMYYPSGPVTPGLTNPNEIWVRTVKWDGSSLGPERQVIVWPNRSFWTPRVAWNSLHNEYMVVWNANNTATGLPNDVAHAILKADGVKAWGAIISTANTPHNVDVTYNVAKDEYFVVWRRMWTPGDGDILGARLDNFNGFVVNPPGLLSVATSTTDQKEPRVATNQQHRYVVVWSEVYDPANCCDWDIRAQELDVNGVLQGGVFVVAQTYDDEESPAVAARPGAVRDYMAVWKQGATAGDSIQALRWGESGVATTGLDVASAAFWDNINPAVMVGGSAFLITYAADAQGDPTVHSHIYMRRYVPRTTYLPVIRR